MIDRNRPEPLYLQIKNDIIAQIENGTIKIGDKLMSENEMIRHYNVGRVTIRTALSELTNEGCLRKGQGLGTFCLAMPNRTQRRKVDVLLNCSDTYLTPSLLSGISGVLDRSDCDMILHDSQNNTQKFREHLAAVQLRGTDGVILHLPSPENDNNPVPPDELKVFDQLNIPVVCICANKMDNFASLCIDDAYGARIATQYVLDCGHTNILGVFPVHDNGVELRQESINRVIRRHPYTIYHQLRTQIITEQTDELLRLIRRNRVSALICYNDFFAVQCMHILQENGYRVPEDISIIGFDDSPLSVSSVPQLTTISHPKDHMGRDAARTLLHRMDGTITAPSHTVYRPELVIRQSVLDISEL